MDSRPGLTRRDALALLGAGATGLVPQQPAPPAAALLSQAIARNDAAVESILGAQVTDRSSPFRGGVPDQFGLHLAASAGGLVEACTASFVQRGSRFFRRAETLDRIRLAADFLERAQSPQGNIDLPTTNFNSPPDTGFVVHNVATAAAIALRHGAPEIAAALRPFLLRAGQGMAAGGVHTPNHRWVISSALAQINEIAPDPRWVRRIDEWLTEGIDIDRDGQYTERSTLTYNVVTDRALVVMSAKLGRPALLEPVRENLRALMYLLHADGEVVTEISRRQDQYTRGGIAGYWFPLTYLALTDRDGRFAALARQAADGARLSTILEYPALLEQPLVPSQPLPDDYEKTFPDVGIVRIRRGLLSATLVQGGSSRVMTLRYGDAVIEGVRFATSFFGKGQFIPDTAEKLAGAFRFRQALEGPYYQPIGRVVTPETWTRTRSERRQTEISRLEQRAEISEVRGGFRLRVQATGTVGVPLAVEVTFREGGRIEGGTPVQGSPGSFVLERGSATYRAGRHAIRFGPGAAPHRYVQLRGAEPKLAGQTVYVTGFTPFDQTFTIDAA
jgi:hypothetical protein